MSSALALGVWWRSAAALTAAVLLLLVENFGASGLNRMLLYLPGVDKILHVTQSALIFGALFYFLGVVPIHRLRRLVIAGSLAIGLALFDEWQQQWMGGRTVELADLAAGFSGVLLGIGGVQRSHWGRAGSFCVATAVIAASVVTYSSYVSTKDYNWGLLAEERSDLVSARRHFLDALGDGTGSAELYNALAWTEVESGVGDASTAVAYAERSLAIRPGDAATLDTYGWALHRAGRSRDAIIPLTLAFQKNPRIYCIHYHLGAAYAAVGSFSEARNHLQQQIAQQPDAIEAGQAAQLLRDLDRSIGNRR